MSTGKRSFLPRSTTLLVLVALTVLFGLVDIAQGKKGELSISFGFPSLRTYPLVGVRPVAL
jgi:hypothetical protein